MMVGEIKKDFPYILEIYSVKNRSDLFLDELFSFFGVHINLHLTSGSRRALISR
jgi:hypothetical protein